MPYWAVLKIYILQYDLSIIINYIHLVPVYYRDMTNVITGYGDIFVCLYQVYIISS